MCEIDITAFVQNADPFEFSASRAERGEHAGRDTWRNAVAEGTSAPMLTTEVQLQALRDHVESMGFGAEVQSYAAPERNALFIQLVSGDMREAGFDDCFIDEFDWDAYHTRASEGQISGNIFRCDIEGHELFGRILLLPRIMISPRERSVLLAICRAALALQSFLIVLFC